MNILNTSSWGILAATATDAQETIPEFWQWIIVGGVGFLLLVGLLAFVYSTRTGMIARASTKEAIRQPVFALLMAIAMVILLLNTWVPFFSLGEDIKMLKDCGLATVLVSGLLLAVWTASTSIAEEIEGKTAMTLLSKPINRRQFIIGKYIGIMQTVALMLLPVMLCFLGLILYKVGYDAREKSAELPLMAERLPVAWQIVPGLVLIFLEIAVLAAVSVAISTQLPMMVNIVTCFTIFVIGHLTPILVKQNTLGIEFVSFMARLIATILPSLEIFNMQTAVATGIVVPPAYIATATVYCAAYGAAVLVLGFILFERRDLA